MPPELIEHETSSVTLEALRATEKTEARREDRPRQMRPYFHVNNLHRRNRHLLDMINESRA